MYNTLYTYTQQIQDYYTTDVRCEISSEPKCKALTTLYNDTLGLEDQQHSCDCEMEILVSFTGTITCTCNLIITRCRIVYSKMVL